MLVRASQGGGTQALSPTVVSSGYLQQGRNTTVSISTSKTYIVVGSRNIATSGLQQVVYKIQNGSASNIGGSNGGLSVSVNGTTATLTSTATSSGPIVSYTVTQVD